jgi:hypothetical protein
MTRLDNLVLIYIHPVAETQILAYFNPLKERTSN